MFQRLQQQQHDKQNLQSTDRDRMTHVGESVNEEEHEEGTYNTYDNNEPNVIRNEDDTYESGQIDDDDNEETKENMYLDEKTG